MGHRSTTFALLANISMTAEERFDWDPVAEKSNSDRVNALLHYQYREPWKLG